MGRLAPLLLLAAAAAALAGGCDRTSPRVVVYRTEVMGTWGSVAVVTADSAARAETARRALAQLHRVDSLMSNWKAGSEVSRLNREAGEAPARVQPEVAEVLATALRVGRESGGAFDITVEPLVRLWGFLGGTPHVPAPARIDSTLARIGLRHVHFDAEARLLSFDRPDLRIDLGGVAKGYGSDRAAAVLRDAGLGDFLVDLSGNMVARGSAPGRRGWSVGVRDPDDLLPYLARFLLVDAAVATSGDYEKFVDEGGRRFGHILDPRTGWPVSGTASVTVVAPTAIQADAWSTALFVQGPEEARRTAREHPELWVVVVGRDDEGALTVWVEEGGPVLEAHPDLASVAELRRF